MPNWCNNVVTINSDDPEKIKRIETAINEGKLFEEFLPFPNGEWDYNWCVENWGTKWDISQQEIIEVTDDSISFRFDTAWSPPHNFYSKMTELGFDIDVMYNETGMQFVGHYTSENGNYMVEYDFTQENWREGITDEDVLYFLDEEYEYYLETKDDEEDEEEE